MKFSSVIFRRIFCCVSLIGIAMNAIPPAMASEKQVHECLLEPMVMTRVGSQVQGVIDKLLVDRGDTVKAGQPIAQLKSSVENANLVQAQTRAKMQSEVSARRADLKLAKHNLKRIDKLHQQKMIPSQQKEESVAKVQVASAALNQALENYELLQLELSRAEKLLAQRTIRSPVDGVVVEQNAFPGEFVYDNAVMTIAQLNPLRVEVILPGRLFNQYTVGDEAIVRPELETSSLVATVDVVDRLLDTRSGTFGVRLLVPNEDFSITGGQRCTVEFQPQIAAATR